MNTSSRPSSESSGFLSRLLYTGLSIWMLGAVYTPALAAVSVNQSPLIIQRTLPPNVVLMLDDSGSMAWDVMPDWSSLSSTSANALVSSDVNGVYYNPKVTYKAPVKADGTFYPDAKFGAALVDGFDADSAIVDISSYDGSKDTSRSNQSASDVGYSALFDLGSYSVSCSKYTGMSTLYPGYCYSSANKGNSDFKYNNNYYYTICQNGGAFRADARDKTVGTCYLHTLFTYTVKEAGGSYTRHYVGKTAGDCAAVSLSPTVCDDDTTSIHTNVANWFSYYHTRILMAKSGVMSAFSDIDSSFRVGFGSLAGSNLSALGSDYYAFTTKAGSNSWSTGIAVVKPFSNGSAGTQKSKLWDWLVGTVPTSSTPLRGALDSIGKYYGTDQPWSGMSSDPDFDTAAGNAELACRQSYTILTTDGFWNGSTPDSIGDADGTAGTLVEGPNSQSYAYAPAAPFWDGSKTTSSNLTPSCAYGSLKKPSGSSVYMCVKSNSPDLMPTCSKGMLTSNQQYCAVTNITRVNYSDTLADVAMKYWSTDLRPDAANEVPTNVEDPAFWQHMTTFTLGLGFTPVDSSKNALDIPRLAAWANGDNTKAITDFTWPKPASESLNNIADLAHAAINGHGGFYSATSPDAFSTGLKDALKRASERVGTGASLAANSTQLQTGTVAYQANYWTAKWKGDLKALSVDSTSGVIDSHASWTASTVVPAAASRNIMTYNPSAAVRSQFVAFKVASDGTLPSLSADQHTALSTVVGTATDEADLINYLRGDSGKELTNGGTYRNRDIVIGDIVNSQPVYAGAPNANQFYTEAFAGSSAFSQFASDHAHRAGAIYVASNDGMLHGFDATTGAENFAYMPGAVITARVSALASVEYGGKVEHGFFNDGELTVADVYIGSTPAWKTVLVGTTGRGVAKAVYALDITDPANIQFLWERSAADGLTDSNYIGQMVGKPVIAQTANGTWSVLIGNGYNSVAAKSALLQFNLADGTLQVHKTADIGGLGAPAVWMDPSGNGVSTTAYAGDADGNLWSFMLNTSDGTDATATPESDGIKLFSAVDSSNNAQPITGGMLVGKDPATGNTWVFFGTGQYLDTTDLTDLSTQSWYGLIVQSGTAGLAITSTKTRTSDLVSRSITAEVGNGRTVTTLAQTAAANTSIVGKSGWYVDLTSPVSGAEGERMVTANQFQGNLLLGTTRIPKATDPCNPSGSGWIMALDPFTGTNPSANFFDRNGDGVINSSDSVNGTPAAGIGFSSLPNNPIFVGSTMLTSFDNGSTSSIKTSSSTGSITRVSWRELIAK